MPNNLPWIDAAKNLLGEKEIPGPRNNLKIVEWAKNIGGWVASYYRQDDIPWCGLFVGHIMHVSGFRPPADMLAAIAWSKWGKKLDRPMYGSIVVFRWRTGRHHVGLIVGQDKNSVHTLGGNQSNAVTVAKFPIASCISFRWPPCEIQPEAAPFAENIKLLKNPVTV